MSNNLPSLRPDGAQPASDSDGMTRRNLLRTAGLIGAGTGIASLLAACGVASKTSSSSSGGASGGTLTLAIDGTSAINDPCYYDTIGDWQAVDCICRGLTFISFETNTVQPDLAESWDISADGTTYTFKLRKGVKFHDGTTLTSADVVASLNRQFDPNDPTLPTGAVRQLDAMNAKVSAVDDSTVRLVIPKPRRPCRSCSRNLTDVGFKVVTQLVEAAAYFGRVLDPKDEYHELMIWERNSYVPDPDNMVGSMADPSGLYGDPATGLSTLKGSDKFTDLIYQAKNLPDGTARTQRARGSVAPDGATVRRRRHGPPGAQCPCLPARVVRRDAPAGDDRPRPGQQPRDPHRRRADHGARRHHPGPGASGAPGHAARARHRGHPDHPRPRRRLRRGDEDRGDVRGPRGRDRHARPGTRPPAPPLHPGAARLRAQPDRSGDRTALGHPRQRTDRGGPPRRLRLRPPLRPGAGRLLSPGPAAAARSGRRASRRLRGDDVAGEEP